jgi:hypothetical protein
MHKEKVLEAWLNWYSTRLPSTKPRVQTPVVSKNNFIYHQNIISTEIEEKNQQYTQTSQVI